MCESAIKNFPGRRIRTDMSDGDRDWEEDFYILRKSWCPAVLTENFFMDNYSDLEYLQSQAGKQAVVDTHVEGIVEWLEMNNIYLCSGNRCIGYFKTIRRLKTEDSSPEGEA